MVFRRSWDRLREEARGRGYWQQLVTDLRVRDLAKMTTEELDHVPCTVGDMAPNTEVVN